MTTSSPDAQGKVLAIYVAFCRLFTAHCLLVQDSNVSGEPQHLYRLRDGVDLSLLEETERMVAAKLDRFRSFHALMSELGDELGIPPDLLGIFYDGQARDLPARYKVIGREFNQIIADALAYTPPASGC